MRLPARAALAAAALAAALAAPAPRDGRAAVLSSAWPTRPADGLRAGLLPVGETAADLSLQPDLAGGLFLAWTEQSGSVLRLQHLDASGIPEFGPGGLYVRSAAGLDIGPAGSRREDDARGRFDLFPTSDGGVLVAWLEDGPSGRDLRVQRLSEAGAAVFPAGGVVALEALPPGPEAVALAPDGADGVLAAAAFGASGAGVLRFQRLRANGTRDHGLPGLAIDADAAAKAFPAVALLGNGDAAVVWHRLGSPASLRLQTLAAGTPRLPAGGAAVAGAADPTRPVSLRAAGTGVAGNLLVAYASGTDARVLLVTAAGAVTRDERAGPAGGAPEITAVTSIVGGQPEGIEVRTRTVEGGAVRLVRPVQGPWQEAGTLVPPAPAGAGAPLALAGPGWFFDLGEVDGSRVLATRAQSAGDSLLPLVGPWLALLPGTAPGVARAAASPGGSFTAWVGPDGGGDSVLAARSGASAGIGLLESRGLEPKTVTVARPPAPRPAKLAAKCPTVSLPAETDPEKGIALEPDLFRVHLGSDAGHVATLDLVSWKGKRGGAWKATVSGPGGTITGSVAAGFGGRNLKIRLAGFPASADERAATLRVELDDRVLGAGVLLDPNPKGTKAVFKASAK